MVEESDTGEIPPAESGEKTAAETSEKDLKNSHEFFENSDANNNTENSKNNQTEMAKNRTALPDELYEWVQNVIQEYNKKCLNQKEKPKNPLKLKTLRDLTDGFIIALLIMVSANNVRFKINTKIEIFCIKKISC